MADVELAEPAEPSFTLFSWLLNDYSDETKTWNSSAGELELGHSSPQSMFIRLLILHMAPMRDAPLGFLIKLLEKGEKFMKKVDPEVAAQIKTMIDDASGEVHRRAFLGFMMVPARKMDNSEYGFLRKPKC